MNLLFREFKMHKGIPKTVTLLALQRYVVWGGLEATYMYREEHRGTEA